MDDEQHTISTLRRAAETAVREHHLDSGVAAAAWSAAHAPHRRREHALAIAAGVLAAVALATAISVWRGGGGHHAASPTSGSACAGNVMTDPLPMWARAGFSSAGLNTPHVLGERGDILAVLFVQLRAHQPAGTYNKILWVARAGYGPLHISAHLEGSTQAVTRELPNGPGPSYVDMPAAGCWQMSLSWAGHQDTLALQYAP